MAALVGSSACRGIRCREKEKGHLEERSDFGYCCEDEIEMPGRKEVSTDSVMKEDGVKEPKHPPRGRRGIL